MLKRYPQLQSGFVSSTENFIEKPRKVETTAMTALLVNLPKTRSQDDFFYSPAMDDLVNDIIQNPLKLREYNFQAKLISCIGEVFEKQPFSFFISVQENNISLSTAHILFLEETIKLVLGMITQRSISIQTWSSVLSSANRDSGTFRAGSFFTQFKDTGFLKMSLAEFITQWIRVAGYSDLVISMQVIFGRRTLHGAFGSSR